MENILMSNKSEVWVFKKHTNNIQLLIEVATYLKANKAGILKQIKDAMYDSLMQTDWYNHVIQNVISLLTQLTINWMPYIILCLVINLN